jgi:hypothetical protein
MLRGFDMIIRGLTVQTMSEADLEVDTSKFPTLESFLALYKDDEDDFLSVDDSLSVSNGL